jgi:hypothetical protein
VELLTNIRMLAIFNLHTLSERLGVLLPDMTDLGIATCIAIAVMNGWKKKAAKGYFVRTDIEGLAGSRLRNGKDYVASTNRNF